MTEDTEQVLRLVDDALRGTYPTGWLEEHTIPPFEEAEEVRRLLPLLQALQATALMTVDGQLGTDGGLMVNQLYLGERDAPSWGELNLDFHDSRRLAEVQAREAGLGYWIIVISRVAPFWTSHWNRFKLSRDRVASFLEDVPNDDVWMHITATARQLLGEAGFTEVAHSALGHQLPWLSTRHGDEAESDSGVSIYAALFANGL